MLFNIGKTHELTQNNEKALESYEKVLELDSTCHKTLVNCAIIKDKMGFREEAIKLL